MLESHKMGAQGLHTLLNQSLGSAPSTTGDVQWKEKNRAPSKEPACFKAAVQESAQVKASLKADIYAKRYAELQRDVETLPKGKLYQRYASEFSSWKRAMYSRQDGVSFDKAALGDFRNWLLHLGPRPRGRRTRDYTADRVDLRKGYEPGNLRWASIAEQNRNRRIAKWIDWSGNRYSRRGFAKLLGVPYKRICKQLERNWPISRIVEAAGGDPDPVLGFRFPEGAAELLEREYRRRMERSSSYYTLNRLDWLPLFYEDQWKAESRPAARSKFKALWEEAKRERERRYAAREALEASKRDELLLRVAPPDPSTAPLSLTEPALSGERARGCNQLQKSTAVSKPESISKEDRERQREMIRLWLVEHRPKSFTEKR
ncbi:hypothetical protein J2X06_002466 [Lysobacter niastensis]|uniref:Uncharacterized protein n=1 Tax=Lysobacter niastensis TaxID=380629 RepID=A0ABU1WD18_9GAMM|nr:hypothetical protein [Lysobacter niastensis]MDR7135257.1 hypothetical protein [Lysobacter niastensis]